MSCMTLLYRALLLQVSHSLYRQVLLLMAVDYFKTFVSLAAASLNNFTSVIVSVIPHLLVLAGFGVFVVWNNGVVLGKSISTQYAGCTDDSQGTKNSTLPAYIFLRCFTSGPTSSSFHGLSSLLPS